MKNMKSWLASVSILGLAAATTIPTYAQEAGTETIDDFDEIVTLGTRRPGRTAVDSPVAIDIFQPEMIESTGYTDMNNALRTLVPGFNAKRLHLNDGSSFVRAITLRSSPADHVLLLMNGKRRHRSATVAIGTGHATTSGSQGQDFNMIPAIAFKSVEVLRDGAAAQYGSDAIAGVINLTLKDANEGGSVQGHVGTFMDGGGRTIDVQGNVGLPLSQNGFVNFSAQYNNQQKTDRAGSHAGAQALVDEGQTGVPIPAIETGEPYYNAIKTAWNSGLQLNDTMRAYMYGNYTKSDSHIGFFYRQPRAAGGLGAHSVFGDSVFDETPIHPEKFDLTQTYPGGFTPEFFGDQSDFSNVFGVTNENEEGFSWDLSFRWGQNKVDYNINNTINPSLGVESPNDFYAGSLEQREYQIDAEGWYNIENDVFFSDLTIFGGFSYRDEAYVIGAGEPASYAIGPLKDLPVGSNGFQGFAAASAGNYSSHSYALYVDMEADVTERWLISAAARYEDYEAFGTNFSYKVATKFNVNDVLTFRGAISTGFRAPAAGQLFGTSQTSQIGTDGDFVLDAVLVPGSEAAQIFGSDQLVPETSFNLSAGLVLALENGLTLTADLYQIDVDDRLLLSPAINTTPADQAALAATGYPNGGAVQTVRYFQNRIDSRVRGFDIIATYTADWGESDATTDFNLALNYNQQILRGDPSGFYSAGQIFEFERGIPSWNGNLSVTHNIGDFSFMVRGIYYGSWKRRNGNDFLPRDAEVLMDAKVTYNVNENIEVHAGARNLFNKYPPSRGPGLERFGLKYDNHSVFGLSGGYYYAGLKYNF